MPLTKRENQKSDGTGKTQTASERGDDRTVTVESGSTIGRVATRSEAGPTTTEVRIEVTPKAVKAATTENRAVTTEETKTVTRKRKK